MKIFKNKKILMAQYGLMVVWLITSLTLAKSNILSPLTITIIFTGILIVPGFSLARLLKFKFTNDKLGQLILWLTLGLTFVLLVCLTTMLISLTVGVLANLCLILIIGLLITSLILDLRYKAEPEKMIWNWKNFLRAENIGYTLVLVAILAVIASVANAGTLLRGGDTDFHMAIVEKASAGQPLALANLSFIKGDTIHIAYGVPIWHVFVGFLSNLTKSDPLAMWKVISVPLSVLAFLAWAWLFQIVFQKRFFIWLGLAYVAIYIYNWSQSYLFTCLPLPDTLNNMFLFPLVTALALKYIFEDKINQKLLVLTSISVVLMATIHITQYLYFLVLIGMFGLVWIISQWQNQDYKKILIRVGWILLGSFLIFVPFLIFLEIRSHIVTKVLAENVQNAAVVATQVLHFGVFSDYDIYSKYAYVFTPIVLALSIKNRHLLFIFALMLVAPIAYFKPVVIFLLKVLGYIFVNRLIGSLTWHYLVLALIFGFVVFIIDKLISKVKVSRFGQYFFNIILVFLAALFVKTQFQLALLPDKHTPTKLILTSTATIYNAIFSDNFSTWFGEHFWWFFIPSLSIAFILIFLQFWKPKTRDFFTLTEPKNGIFASFAIVILLAIFFSPTWTYVKTSFSSAFEDKILITQTNIASFRQNTTRAIGGADMVDFIQKNIPAKSIFLTPGSTVYTFPVILDQFMTAYPRTGALNRYNRVYEGKWTLNECLILIYQSKAQYITLYAPVNQDEAFFDAHPEYFKKIFKSDSVIYQVLPALKVEVDKLANVTNAN